MQLCPTPGVRRRPPLVRLGWCVELVRKQAGGEWLYRCIGGSANVKDQELALVLITAKTGSSSWVCGESSDTSLPGLRSLGGKVRRGTGSAAGGFR